MQGAQRYTVAARGDMMRSLVMAGAGHDNAGLSFVLAVVVFGRSMVAGSRARRARSEEQGVYSSVPLRIRAAMLK